MQRYGKRGGEITIINTMGLLKNQRKWDPEVIPIGWTLTEEKIVSLNLEKCRKEETWIKICRRIWDGRDNKDVKVICVG